MNKLKPLKDKGVALVFLDHTRKPNNFEGQTPKKEQLFASQDKVASVEVVLMLKNVPGKEEIFVHQVKNRLGREIDPFQINIQDVVDQLGNPIKVSLVFKGGFLLQEHKQDRAEEIVMSAVQDGGKTTNELITIIKLEKISERNARAAIRSLEKRGKLLCHTKRVESIFTPFKKMIKCSILNK